jgi:RNA polymerase sigma factor for flagellar operon FliA
VPERDPTSPLTSAEARSYLPAIRRIAARLARRLPPSVERDDLLAAGMLGLVEVFARHGDRTTKPNASYVELRVRGAMLDALRGDDPLSRWGRAAERRAAEARHTLERRLGRAPTEDELALSLDVDLDTYRARELAAARARLTSLTTLLGDEESPALCDERTPPVDELLDAHRLRAWAQRALVGLPERLRWVAYGYASGTPARVLGDELGVSVGRVSQLHAQALGLLRGELDAWLAGPRRPAPGLRQAA